MPPSPRRLLRAPLLVLLVLPGCGTDLTGPSPAPIDAAMEVPVAPARTEAVDPWVADLVHRLGGGPALFALRASEPGAIDGPEDAREGRVDLRPLHAFSEELLRGDPEDPETMALSLVLAIPSPPRTEVSR